MIIKIKKIMILKLMNLLSKRREVDQVQKEIKINFLVLRKRIINLCLNLIYINDFFFLFFINSLYFLSLLANFNYLNVVYSLFIVFFFQIYILFIYNLAK